MAEAKAAGEPKKGHGAGSREKRLLALPHWSEIEARLQHGWSPNRVAEWHKQRWPKEDVPGWRTLHRYLEDKPESWFFRPSLLPQNGKRVLSRVIVAEKQAELIEFQFSRIASARPLEEQLGGFLSPQVDRSVDLADRLLMNHQRTLQESGLEPKVTPLGKGGDGDPDDRAGSYVRELSEVVHRFVDLPEGEFMPAVIALIGPPAVKQPLVLEAEGFVVDERSTREPRDADPAG